LTEPEFDYGRICLPPATYAQEKHKIEVRLPAALRFIREQRLNETFAGEWADIGVITQGGLYNSVLRALQQLGLADTFGAARVPIHVLNVTYPLVPEELAGFCAGKRAVLMVEEGQPDYLEQALHVMLRKHDLNTRVFGKDCLPMAGEYTALVMLEGITRFLQESRPAGLAGADLQAPLQRAQELRQEAAELLGRPVPSRPPSFCTGCPERPVFSALKLVEREIGKIHIAADIGCHTFSTLAPFNLGNSVLGYGLGLASAAAVAPVFDKRVVSIMGDGGFWHNGLASGVSNAVLNHSDSVLIVFSNGYTAATGQQLIPSSQQGYQGAASGQSIRRVLKGLGVRWVRTVTTYDVGRMVKILKQALSTRRGGLKVLIAESECQLARQRRIRPQIQARLARGKRVVRTRFGVDPDVCTGDHSCIRLSGCPSLTIKPNPDPLRTDPVAHVDNACVGCGLCGEVAQAAALCPSFYRADIIQHPGHWDRWLDRVRRRVIERLRPARV
jgi:indolepyruvate ferredoxin oxidoreductase alpha subunit